jgi:glycosidase
MKRCYPLRSALFQLTLFIATLAPASSQVTVDPVFPNVDDNVTICYNAAEGNGALAGVSPVYAHMGVITDQSTSPNDWKYVATTWAVNDADAQMTPAGPNLWKKTINIRQFFGIPQNETVLQLAFVFRNADGSIVGRAAGGGDIFYDVYPENGPLETIFVTPQPTSLLSSTGAAIAIKAAASQPATLTLYDNGVQVASGTGELLETTLTAGAAGLHTVTFVATTGSQSDTSTFLYIVPLALPAADPPAGSELGITELSPSSVRLVLYAPDKQVVYAIGDFSNWLPDPAYQMRNSVDGTLWWIDLTGLTPGQIYRLQYLVDGTLRIADPLSTLVLDRFNDGFIPSVTYPDVPDYPLGQTDGDVTVFRTDEPEFSWEAADYERPKKTDLVIYELLVRDFVHRHDFQTIQDTLDYLERLGVTAIELMPVSEFDGNVSWGYNPSYHKALDKYYGTAEALKMLIDEAHKRNIAVILDVVYNHVTGASPLAQLYWDQANNRPAADNPWLNPVPKHEFNVFNDFNHESAATKAYVKNTMAWWIEEFRVDGFRFDLSKGLTQKNTLGSVSAWGQYDPTRITILKDYADFIWDLDPQFYVILEHFADNNEEKELAQYGMMLWGNMHFQYKEVGLGFPAGIGTSLSGVSYKDRGWAVPHLIGYMESHDEERIVWDLKNFGNTVGSYNIKFHKTAMRRVEMLNNLLYTVPGPKMLWQFGEIGYDYSINTCENGTVSNDCRLSPKPIKWEYYLEPHRRRLYDVTAALLHLRKNLDVFETTDFQISLGSGQGRWIRLNSPNEYVHVIANVGTTNQTITANFQHPGWWYEYYSGDSLLVSNVTPALSMQPGEYRLYIDKKVSVPAGLNPTPTSEAATALRDVDVYPNPASSTVFIDFTLLERTQAIAIDVIDLTGRVIYREEIGTLPAGEQSVELPAAGWAPGFYQVRLRDGSGGSVVRKVVKN